VERGSLSVPLQQFVLLEILSQICVTSLTLWLHDVVGHVILFVVLDILMALYWNWRTFEVRLFSHFAAISI